MIDLPVEVRCQGRPLAAGGRLEIELVIARLVREEGDPFPVGRDRRVHLPRAGRVGKVDGPLLAERDRKDVAPGFQDHGLAVVGRINIVNVFARVDDPVAQDPPVGRHEHADLFRLAGFEVEQVDVAVLDEDDILPVGVGPHDVKIGVGRDRPRLPGPYLLGVDVGDTAPPVGDKIHRIADPHRVGVLAHVIRDRGILLGVAVVKPDVRILAPLVALPIVLLVPPAGIEEAPGVGREADQRAALEGEPLRRAALDGSIVEVRVPADDVLEHRPEDDLGPVGRPADDLRKSWLVGQAGGSSAVGGHDISGRRPVVARRKGDLLSVRGKLGEGLGPGVAGDAAGPASLGARQPEVALIGENDLVLMDRRVAEEPALVEGEGATGGERQNEDSEDQLFHDYDFSETSLRLDTVIFSDSPGQVKHARRTASLSL